MKKILFSILCFVAIGVHAQEMGGVCGESMMWTVDFSTNTLTITGTGKMNSYYTKSDERAPWYSCRSSIKTVTVGEGVTSIGEYAFNDLPNLVNVSLPNTLSTIGLSAFRLCTGLKEIVIPNSVAEIGDDAFNQCSGLENITLSDHLEILGAAFGYTTNLKSITIPKSVTYINGSSLFLKSGVESITVESGNEEYDSRNNCNAIINVHTNELVAGCKGSSIPNTVTSIGIEAFRGVDGLTSITIPSSVTEIGYAAFMDCTGLTSINIPSSVTKIGSQAFSGCYNMKTVTVHWEQPLACPDDVFLPSVSGRTLFVPAGTSDLYYVINAWKFFTYRKELPSDLDFEVISEVEKTCRIIAKTDEKYSGIIVIPDSLVGYVVTEIGQGAFVDCTGLKSVTLPNTLKYIGMGAFMGCKNLTFIYFPPSVERVESRAFTNCPKLKTIVAGNRTPPQLMNAAFTDSNAKTDYDRLIVVPANAVSAYKTYPYWRDFQSIVGGGHMNTEDVNQDNAVNSLDVLKIYKYMQAH